MKALDYFLQSQRIKVVAPFLAKSRRILDVGCFDDSFAKTLKGGQTYLGIDEDLDVPEKTGNPGFVKGRFPQALNSSENFDTITALAVFEHIPEEEKIAFAKCCADRLEKNGKIILTVPSPQVDRILDTLKFFRALDGMDDEAHHEFDVKQTPQYFLKAGCRLDLHKTFQFGLNNLFIFTKN